MEFFRDFNWIYILLFFGALFTVIGTILGYRSSQKNEEKASRSRNEIKLKQDKIEELQQLLQLEGKKTQKAVVENQDLLVKNEQLTLENQELLREHRELANKNISLTDEILANIYNPDTPFEIYLNYNHPSENLLGIQYDIYFHYPLRRIRSNISISNMGKLEPGVFKWLNTEYTIDRKEKGNSVSFLYEYLEEGSAPQPLAIDISRFKGKNLHLRISTMNAAFKSTIQDSYIYQLGEEPFQDYLYTTIRYKGEIKQTNIGKKFPKNEDGSPNLEVFKRK